MNKKDEIMSHLLGLIPINHTKEVFELWDRIARLIFILDKIVPKSFMEEEFIKECECYSHEFLKQRFPNHFKEKISDENK